MFRNVTVQWIQCLFCLSILVRKSDDREKRKQFWSSVTFRFLFPESFFNFVTKTQWYGDQKKDHTFHFKHLDLTDTSGNHVASICYHPSLVPVSVSNNGTCIVRVVPDPNARVRRLASCNCYSCCALTVWLKVAVISRFLHLTFDQQKGNILRMWILISCLLIFSLVSGEVPEEEIIERKAKILPIFQVVKFPNDVCNGGTRNGTCYTALVFRFTIKEGLKSFIF